jgi:hypothetical protein
MHDLAERQEISYNVDADRCSDSQTLPARDQIGRRADNTAGQPTGGNDPLTMMVEVAVSDRLGAERRKSSTETRMYGLAVRPRRRSRDKPAPGTPGRASIVISGDGPHSPQVSACGCGDGVPV